MTDPTHSTTEYWQSKAARADGGEAEYWKALFHKACGYISTRPEWSSKHPEEVAHFFQAEAER